MKIEIKITEISIVGYIIRERMKYRKKCLFVRSLVSPLEYLYFDEEKRRTRWEKYVRQNGISLKIEPLNSWMFVLDGEDINTYNRSVKNLPASCHSYVFQMLFNKIKEE